MFTNGVASERSETAGLDVRPPGRRKSLGNAYKGPGARAPLTEQGRNGRPLLTHRQPTGTRLARTA